MDHDYQRKVRLHVAHLLLFECNLIWQNLGIVTTPLVDHVWTIVAVWKKRGKIIRTVLCSTVYSSCAQWYAHTYEQILKLTVGLGLCLGLCFVFFFWMPFCSCVVHFCWVRFTVVSSVLSQEISWEERIQNDLFCLKLDVKHLLSNSGWASFLCVLLRLRTPVVYRPPCSRWIMLSRLPSWSWGVIRQTVCEVGLYKTSGCWRWRTACDLASICPGVRWQSTEGWSLLFLHFNGKNPCHQSTEILFWNGWKKKTKGERAKPDSWTLHLVDVGGGRSFPKLFQVRLGRPLKQNVWETTGVCLMPFLPPNQQHQDSNRQTGRHPFNGLFSRATWVSWHQKD